MRMRKPVLSVVVLCMITALSACAFNIGNPDKRVTSGIGLKATKDVFVATATSAKRLCEQGVLSEDDCETAEIVYMEGKEALLSAKEVWDILVTLEDFDGNAVIVINEKPLTYNYLIKSVVKFTTMIETIIRKGDR